MRVFKNAWFGRFARKRKISEEVIWDAVDRAEKGLVDADLGGGVIKQRIARPQVRVNLKVIAALCCIAKETRLFLFMASLRVILATFVAMKKSSLKRQLS